MCASVVVVIVVWCASIGLSLSFRVYAHCVQAHRYYTWECLCITTGVPVSLSL